jgi:hypothetical protein
VGLLNLRDLLKVIGTPPIYREVRTSSAAGRGLGDLPGPRKPRQLYRRGAVRDKSPALGAGKPTAESTGLIEKARIFETSLGLDTLLTKPSNKPYSSADFSQNVPRLFKASSNVSLGEERSLDDHAGLTINNGLQNGLYTHRCQAGSSSSNRPGVETPDHPAPV